MQSKLERKRVEIEKQEYFQLLFAVKTVSAERMEAYRKYDLAEVQ